MQDYRLLASNSKFEKQCAHLDNFFALDRPKLAHTGASLLIQRHLRRKSIPAISL
jgi:hypothetical protein